MSSLRFVEPVTISAFSFQLNSFSSSIFRPLLLSFIFWFAMCYAWYCWHYCCSALKRWSSGVWDLREAFAELKVSCWWGYKWKGAMVEKNRVATLRFGDDDWWSATRILLQLKIIQIMNIGEFGDEVVERDSIILKLKHGERKMI